MIIRRVRTQNGLRHERADGDAWVPYDASRVFGPEPFDSTWILAAADRSLLSSSHLIPFQPISFRDFLLYEEHNIDASRGYVRHFLPKTYLLTTAFERATGRVFPRFKPPKLLNTQPVYYMGNHNTFVPSGTPVSTPARSTALDYELELGFVLSKPLLNADPDEALAAIGAFVVVNDFSARDIQRAEMDSGFGLQKSKHFLSSMSSTAATAQDILPQIESIAGTVEINGIIVAQVSTRGLRWSLGEVLAHASRSEQLVAGELFATGTLPGGCALENGHWLRPSDHLRFSLDGIGTIEHRIE